MIDVDPDPGLADRRENVISEALPGRGVEREDDVEILRFVRREGDQFAAWKERKFLEQAFFVPDFNLFTQLLERQAHRNLTAESVPIRAHMTQDNKGLVAAQDLRDLRESRVR